MRAFTPAARRRCAVLGVPLIPLLGSQHAHATLALEAGVRIDVVSRHLDHASIATTGDLYAHDSNDVSPDAAAALGGLLDARGGIAGE